MTGNDFCFELSGGSKKLGFEKSGFYCSYFSWNLAYSLTSIDCLVKSKPYQRNTKFFLVRKVQENFETALWIVEPLKTALFRTTTKKSTTSDKSVEAFQCSFQFRAMQPSCPKGTNSPPLSSPGAMLFWLNIPSVHFFCYRKQHCNRGGGKTVFQFATVSIFVRVRAKNRYFCNVSQQVLSDVVGLRLLWLCPCFISWISTIHM